MKSVEMITIWCRSNSVWPQARARSSLGTVDGRISSAVMPNLVRISFVLPLLGQRGRAQHGKPAGLPPGQQLLGDQAGLDGFADARCRR